MTGKIKSIFRTGARLAAISVALSTVGCPSDKKQDKHHEHKQGDDHDHDKENEKKKE